MSIAGALVILAVAIVVLSGTILIVVGGSKPKTPKIEKPVDETAVSDTAVAEEPTFQKTVTTALYIGGAPLPKDPSEWTTFQKKAVLQVGDWVWVGKGEHRWRIKSMGEDSVVLWRFVEGAVPAGVSRKAITRSFPWELIRFSSHTGRRRNNRKA